MHDRMLLVSERKPLLPLHCQKRDQAEFQEFLIILDVTLPELPCRISPLFPKEQKCLHQKYPWRPLNMLPGQGVASFAETS